MGIRPSFRNVKETVIAAIGKLEAMRSDRTSHPGAHRSAHVFLLTSQLDDGVIDSVPEVLMGKMQIHIFGIGPVFWPRNEMEPSGRCVPLSASGLRPNIKDCRSEQMTLIAKEIVSTLRTGMHLGGAQNFIVRLCHSGDSRINPVISDTKYHHLVTVGNQILIKVDPGNPTDPTPTDIDARDLTDNLVPYRATNQLNTSQPRVYETLLLTIAPTYPPSSHPSDTTLSISGTA